MFLAASLRTSLVCLFLSAPLYAADYQWSVPIDGGDPKPIDPGYPRAFLWVPPNCRQIRAVVIAQNNMQEESILEDSTFRKTLSDLGFAEIWVIPSFGSIHFRFDLGADQKLEKTLKDLAEVSGYSELQFAPLVSMGHSAMASFGWDIAAWNPGRTLAVLSVSGQWPYYKDMNMNQSSSPDWGERTVDGVPGLTTKGEFEISGNTDGWYFHLKGDSLKQHPKTAFTQVVEPGAGHFNASARKIALICLYLRKAAQFRLPASSDPGPVTLEPINPTQSGWLFDQWHLNQGPTVPAAPVPDYQGNKDQAFWAFDEEMAKAIEDFQAQPSGKVNLLVGYKQSDGLTPPTPDHGMVHLKFQPESDGITFKLSGGFWDAVPSNPKGDVGGATEWEQWLGEGNPPKPGDPLQHPQGMEGKIVISRITGPFIQTAPDTFVIHPYRIGTEDPKRSNDLWFSASYPGDDTYKPMVQQAELRFPLKNTTGAAQTITFPPIPDQTVGAAPIKLPATSSTDLPVSYYVREGPAEVSLDGTLSFTPIPARAKFPIQVTVVACQWGRSIDPKVQTAEPVIQTFSINRK